MLLELKSIRGVAGGFPLSANSQVTYRILSGYIERTYRGHTESSQVTHRFSLGVCWEKPERIL